ncbi:MAG: nitrilase-related carbon-nitrogen hydrolase [Halanaerobiales bacterium]
MKLEKAKLFLLRKYLKWICRKLKIKRYIRSKPEINIEKSNLKEQTEDLKIKAAVVQCKIKLYNNPFDFIDKMIEFIQDAVSKRAELIVFPEDNLLQLIGILPGIKNISLTDSENTDKQSSLDDIEITDILKFVGPIIKEATNVIFSELAKKYSIFIMSGSGLFPENNSVYNIAYLYNGQGEKLGHQKKIHLLPLEADWGINPGEKLEVFQTEIGNLAFPICMDATYFETFRIAANMKADIVMIPTANPEAYFNYWTALRGIWGRVQESQVYGLKSSMVGSFLGYKFTGQAGIYAPIEMSSDKNGIIQEAESYDQEELIIADLNIDELHDFKRNNTELMNRQIWEKYFPDIYYNL